MSILITGATGYIGRHLTEELLARGESLVAVGRSTEAPLRHERLSYHTIDFRHIEAAHLAEWGKPKTLVHLAWGDLDDYRNPSHMIEHLPSHMHFLHAMLGAGVVDITVAGTCLEYGLIEGVLHENQACQPVTSYGLAKLTLLRHLQLLQKSKSFHLKWPRLFYSFGDGQNSKSVLAALQRAIDSGQATFDMSAGEQLRDFLPVNRMAEHLADIILQTRVTGVINCCSGVPVSIRKLVEDYVRERNTDMQLNLGVYPYPDYEPMAFWGNRSKLDRILAVNH